MSRLSETGTVSAQSVRARWTVLNTRTYAKLLVHSSSVRVLWTDFYENRARPILLRHTHPDTETNLAAGLSAGNLVTAPGGRRRAYTGCRASPPTLPVDHRRATQLQRRPALARNERQRCQRPAAVLLELPATPSSSFDHPALHQSKVGATQT